jgi:hypothetical protein
MEKYKVSQQNFSIKRNHWMIGSTHELGDNMVVPITISPNEPILGCKLININ